MASCLFIASRDPFESRDVEEGYRLVSDVVKTSRWCQWLFPESPRVLPYARGISIAFRTVHIAAIGILLGGHVFAVPDVRLLPWLYLSLVSGTGLIGIELYRSR